jgi:hypothetical protein
MSFLESIKEKMNPPLCSLEITRVEKQEPGNVKFPVTDSVFKGNFRITALKPCKVISHRFALRAEKLNKHGYHDEIYITEEIHDESSDIGGMTYKWPYKMAEGESQIDGCCIIQLDLLKELKPFGYKNKSQIINDKDLTMYFIVSAKVKGRSEEYEARTTFTLTE